jgi:hypothetical protein
MIDATRICSKLYQGSFPAPHTPLKRYGFDCLVLCADELQPPSNEYSDIFIIRVPMDEGPADPRTMVRAAQAAEAVKALIQKGYRTLVTCRMGLNRSGLVSALTLRSMGISGHNARKIVQMARPRALCNPRFAEALDSLDAPKVQSNAMSVSF